MSLIEPLPHLRFEIAEAASILRISRATLYERIGAGLIEIQKDGRRTFVTETELRVSQLDPNFVVPHFERLENENRGSSRPLCTVPSYAQWHVGDPAIRRPKGLRAAHNYRPFKNPSSEFEA